MNIVYVCLRIKTQLQKHLLGYSMFTSVLSSTTLTSFLDSLLNLTLTDMICRSHINPSDCLDVNNAVHQVFLVLSLLWHKFFVSMKSYVAV